MTEQMQEENLLATLKDAKTSTDEAILRNLARHPNQIVRNAVVNNRFASAELIAELSHDIAPMVETSVRKRNSGNVVGRFIEAIRKRLK